MDDLLNGLKTGNAVLFAGAGLSAGLGAPTWSGLIAKMGSDLGYDPKIFSSSGATAWALAEYYKITKGTIGPLRSWMDKEWHATDEDIKESSAHKIIAGLGFETIYTTNYDRNIERSFDLYNKDYYKISNVRDFATSRKDRTNIIKLHGDFDDDKSIVLAESDYFSRLNFDSPLDVRLRSDALAKPVLFVGYSLADFNIRYLLFKLWETWKASGYGNERPKSYIFLTRPDPISEAIFKNWGVEPIVGTSDDPGESLVIYLSKLQAELTKRKEAK